jgi:hypothetical protein
MQHSPDPPPGAALIESIKVLLLQYMRETGQQTFKVEVHACLAKGSVAIYEVMSEKNRIA